MCIDKTQYMNCYSGLNWFFEFG